jgi:FlaA1/EpsC-like NDP-sugar epimerase
MRKKVDVKYFINNYITQRNDNFLEKDILKYKPKLSLELNQNSALVIGGAGTIGKNYIKALLKFRLKKLIVIDINENGLTELVRSLRSSNNLFIPDELITYPISFSDNLFLKIFKSKGPFDVIANFAAHKHVRSEKDMFSVEAMISNNFLNAKELMDVVSTSPPRHFFCVSTDKATDPKNIMGASKLLMEKLIFSYKNKINVKTARFANVAFSNGSLLDGYINRYHNMEPLACPLKIKRYFLSPKESGELCLLASILGNSGDIFFPKMSASHLISFEKITIDFLNYLEMDVDYCESESLAIKKSNLLNDNSNSYPVYFFKPNTTGEKSFEEFYSNNDKPDFSRFNNLGVLEHSNEIELSIENCYKEFLALFIDYNYSKNDIIKLLKKYLNNFSHKELGKNLDNQM